MIVPTVTFKASDYKGKADQCMTGYQEFTKSSSLTACRTAFLRTWC